MALRALRGHLLIDGGRTDRTNVLRTALISVQAATMLGAGALLAGEHHWRLAAAQLLLAIVTGLVYL